MHHSSTDIFDVAGMRTTRSQAQEETYSSSSEEEAEGASVSGNSEPDDSSPASSKANLQVCKELAEVFAKTLLMLFLSLLQCECPE